MKLKKTRYSLPHFFTFLEAVWQEKLVRKNTLKRWQDAITEFQKVLRDEEVVDLRCIDIKQIASRYIDLLVEQRSSITPWRIYHLKNALAQAIGDFVAFTINPNEYKRTTSLALAKQVYLQSRAQSTAPAAVISLPSYHGAGRLSAVAR